MKQFLIFNTIEQATTANEVISNQMTFGVGTTTWAQPIQRTDGKYCFAKPETQYMIGVQDYVEATYDRSWFEIEE